jgi:pantothenate kinase
VAPLLDACWYVDVAPDVRVRRLVARHHEHGKSLADAEAWAHGSDQVNADTIEATRGSADRVVTAAEVDALLVS